MLKSKMEAEIFVKICRERTKQFNSPESSYNANFHGSSLLFFTAINSPPYEIPVRVYFKFTSFRFFSPTCENKRSKVSYSIL